MKVDSGLREEVEQFLYEEAELLDLRRYDEWLNLFTDDVRYWVPVVYTREEGSHEVAGDRDLAYFDDDKRSLTLRVKRLRTEFAHAENPPSRTCRMVSNVRLVPTEKEGEIKVLSNFILYRNRLEEETDIFAGRREDTLRRVDGSWKIATRKILLAQNVLQSKNISVFI